MKTLTALLTATLLVAAPVAAKETSPRPDQLAFREIYKELVETNTTLSAGSCTEAAAKMGARLKAAGFADSDIHLLTEPDHLAMIVAVVAVLGYLVYEWARR